MTAYRITDDLVALFGRKEAEIERALETCDRLDREAYEQRLRQVRAAWEAFLATGREAPNT